MKDLIVRESPVTLQIWDTAGQETFRSLGSAFYRGADACMLVFDVTNKYSFECLDGWLDNFLRTTGKLPLQDGKGRDNTLDEQGDPVSLVAVGNKIDLKEGGTCVITREMAEEWCKTAEKRVGGSIAYYETSASADTNVEEAFYALTNVTLDRYQERDRAVTQGDATISLQNDKTDSPCAC
jgi:Ras-related protein Rab-7A